MIDPYRQIVALRGKVHELGLQVEQLSARIAELERKLAQLTARVP